MARCTRKGARGRKMSSKRRLKALILDYDGVIVESMGPQEEAWRDAAREVGVSSQVEEGLVANLYSGHSGDRMFEDLGLPAEVRRNLRTAKDRRWELECAKVPLFSGAAEAIRRLARLCSIGIATTANRRHVYEMLTRNGIQNYIASIATDRDAPRPKPYPDMLLNLIHGPLCADADSSLMVGDTDTDREMAESAGIDFLLFDGGAKAPQVGGMVVMSWDDLERFVIGRVKV